MAVFDKTDSLDGNKGRESSESGLFLDTHTHTHTHTHAHTCRDTLTHTHSHTNTIYSPLYPSEGYNLTPTPPTQTINTRPTAYFLLQPHSDPKPNPSPLPRTFHSIMSWHSFSTTLRQRPPLLSTCHPFHTHPSTKPPSPPFLRLHTLSPPLHPSPFLFPSTLPPPPHTPSSSLSTPPPACISPAVHCIAALPRLLFSRTHVIRVARQLRSAAAIFRNTKTCTCCTILEFLQAHSTKVNNYQNVAVFLRPEWL